MGIFSQRNEPATQSVLPRIDDPKISIRTSTEELDAKIDRRHSAIHGIASLLDHLEPYKDRPRAELEGTPGRVVKAFEEMTAGYRMSPAEILSKAFEADTDEMIVLRGISFVSLCEHHLLPFLGTATVGYLPKDGKVAGVSKLARLVECFSKRLQLQERMTQQIADALQVTLEPRGVGVVVRAHHSCMGCRGVMQANAEMVTSALLRAFKEQPSTRQEFLSIAGVKP
jgi:GTP cyclohydrolase IA